MNNLKSCIFFHHFSEEQLQLMLSFSVKKNYKSGQILFYEKEMPTNLQILIKGTLKVFKTDLKDNEIVMNRFQPTSMIAEAPVLENRPYPASAIFETNGTVLKIDFLRFKQEFFKDPDVALKIFHSLSMKIKHLENVIELNIVLDSTARLAKYLCDNRDDLKNLKKYQLAQTLHMTPETLSRTLKKLLVLGLVVKGDEGYEIKNREGLKVLFA
ncbi:MAG: Crp/Fnr family transcriptional regulator [Sulfurimonas sp.]